MARDLTVAPPQINPSVQSHNNDHQGDTSDEYSDNYDEGDEVQQESEMLYRQFLHHRLEEEQLNYPRNHQSLSSSLGPTTYPSYPHYGHSYPDRDRFNGSMLTGDSFDRHGYRLRSSDRRVTGGERNHLEQDLGSLTDSFRRSGGRQEVSRRAAMVDLGSLSQENLTLMLSELFHDGGITQERILVLFYFCADLAVRAVKSGLLTIVSSLTKWSLAFIRGPVSAWVRCCGGWADVLRLMMTQTNEPSTNSTINQVAFVSACAAVMGVCAVYIKKNL